MNVDTLRRIYAIELLGEVVQKKVITVDMMENLFQKVTRKKIALVTRVMVWDYALQVLVDRLDDFKVRYGMDETFFPVLNGQRERLAKIFPPQFTL